MVEPAAHLGDHVFPDVQIRQFVLVFPFPLRFLFAQREALSRVLEVFQRGISTILVLRSGLTMVAETTTGAVNLIQRFDSALNLNVHLHILFASGVIKFHSGRVTFHRAGLLDHSELNRFLKTLNRRIVKVLARCSLLIAGSMEPYLALEPGSDAGDIQSVSFAYRTVIGPHAGRKALAHCGGAPLNMRPDPLLMAKTARSSLHAATVSEACVRCRPERLCRYVTRPRIATKRLSVDMRGQVVCLYQAIVLGWLGQVVLEAPDFIDCLAALFPRPRSDLARLQGAFVPNFKHGLCIVSQRTASRFDRANPRTPMIWMQR